MSDTAPHADTPENRGWTRRFIACEPRLGEAVRLYRESGFDILLLELSAEKSASNCTKSNSRENCRECYKGVEDRYRIIYTRPHTYSS